MGWFKEREPGGVGVGRGEKLARGGGQRAGQALPWRLLSLEKERSRGW